MSALTKVNPTGKFAVLDLSSVKIDHAKVALANSSKRELTRANKEVLNYYCSLYKYIITIYSFKEWRSYS